MTLRAAAFAGRWYPGEPDPCRAAIAELEREAPPGAPPCRAGIVPHAGWRYSGKAALAVVRACARTDVDLVLLFGRHMRNSSPHTLLAEGAWATPLGDLEVDAEVAARLAADFEFDDEHEAEPDNGLELVLPFVKHYLPAARLVAVGAAPRAECIEVGRAAARHALALGRRAVALGSTDLTHYGASYGWTGRGSAQQALPWVKTENDRGFIERLLARDPQGALTHADRHRSACCPGAAAAALGALEVLGAGEPMLLAYYTSHDVAPADSFVGYAAIGYAA